jgi:hypothetical protein
MAYQPRVGKTRWRRLVAEQQQRNREMIVDLERLLTTAPTTEVRNAILRMIIAAQANLLDLAELATIDG